MQQIAGKDELCWLELRNECLQPRSDIALGTEWRVNICNRFPAEMEVGDDEGIGSRKIHRPIPIDNVVHNNGQPESNKTSPKHANPAGLLFTPNRVPHMSDALADKRTATRFRVLVEIADRQPAVSQGEIADSVGVTSQAVSEYIRELIDDGLVHKDGRSRYAVTKEGVDWLFQEAKSLQQYADHVTDDVLGSVQEDTAIATEDISVGQQVTLSVRDGLLHATPGTEGPATGVATTEAESGTDVSITSFEGVIDMTTGKVTVAQVPPARNGGSRAADIDALDGLCAEADRVLAEDVEGVVSLREAGYEPATTVASGEVAAAAAQVGMTVVIAASTDTVGRVTDVLREDDTTYDVTTL